MSPTFDFSSSLRSRLRLAVDEVVHHDDVMPAIVVLPRYDVPARDPYPRDPGIVEDDTEERQAAIARRRRNEAAEQEPFVVALAAVVGREEVDPRAGLARPVDV